MQKQKHPLEQTVEIITHNSVELEVVERPEVLWVGCAGYADNNAGEPDIGAILKRFQSLNSVERREPVAPGWSAALSINYTRDDRPCGMMFANETYSDAQDELLDLFRQPAGLWLRVCNDAAAAKALLDRDSAEPWEYFSVLREAAAANGYLPDPETCVEVEYHCHAEYATPPHTNYAYIPIRKA